MFISRQLLYWKNQTYYFFHFVWLDETTEEGNSSEHSDSDVRERPNTKYRLVGVVVHSGQASGGHYYSYIRCELQTPGQTMRLFVSSRLAGTGWWLESLYINNKS